MRWVTNFYDFSFKWIATAGIRIHPTKAWLSQLVNFKNANWHIRWTICNTIVLNLEKCHRTVWNASDCFSTKSGEEGVRKSIHQCLLAKGLGLGLLCWGLKGVQEEIPREEASTLQIGSVEFPLGQCTSPQLSPCHRLFDQDGHQHSSSAFLSSRPCSLWLLVIP